MNNTNYAKATELPSFIIIKAHDGEGNERPVRYINEEALRYFMWGVERELGKLDEYILMGKEEK